MAEAYGSTEPVYGSVRTAITERYAGLCSALENYDAITARIMMKIQQEQMKLAAVPWWDPYSAAFYKYQIAQLNRQRQQSEYEGAATIAEQNVLRSQMDVYERADATAKATDAIMAQYEKAGIPMERGEVYQRQAAAWQDSDLPERGPLSYDEPEAAQDPSTPNVAVPGWLRGLVNNSVGAQQQAAMGYTRESKGVSREDSAARQAAATAEGLGVQNPLRGLSSQNRNIDESKVLQMMGYLGFQKAGGKYNAGVINAAIANRESWFKSYWTRMQSMMPSAARLPKSRSVV
jgi:hypothetical protein